MGQRVVESVIDIIGFILKLKATEAKAKER